MSITMKPIPFPELLRQAMGEYRARHTLFGVPVAPVPALSAPVELYGTALESVIGPAAGPHTQLSQNLAAGYAAGGRFFELKTVQVLWGEELGIQRPCIFVRDEGYNTEWSTELSPEQAAEEYIKGWLLLKLLCREFDLGSPEGFVFNLSVGYDLPGIQSPSVDRFLNVMKDASLTPFWGQCIDEALRIPFEQVDEAYIRGISPNISNNITLSTMHGCPPEQIEAIAAYLMEEKGLHTSIKCNPTLVGREAARRLLDAQGYEDIRFDPAQFDHDMKREDALPMLRRLLDKGKALGLRFGVKLTNTFPVKIEHGELAGETMYLSGKALFPLSLATARLLTEELEGELPISFSGGADEHCAGALFGAGIYPITVATVLLKRGGYKNLSKLAGVCALEKPVLVRVDGEKLAALEKNALEHSEHFRRKEPKKALGQVPPFACGRCTTCMDVCPNRANYLVPGLKQKGIHLDGPCNDCGACACACPFGFRPYADKFVLFPDEATLRESVRDGFVLTGDGCLVRYQKALVQDLSALPDEVKELMEAVRAMELAQ
jgi:putative selenate reductase